MILARRWAWCAGVLLTTCVLVSLLVSNRYILAVVSDISALLLIATATVFMFANAYSSRGQLRAFWFLMALGSLLWTINEWVWFFYEVMLNRSLPDPSAGDVILFTHVVPMMAAVALRPHRQQEERRFYVNALNFLMLLVCWLFLYAFIVFPDEYVRLSVDVYSHHFDVLYLIENILLLAFLMVAAAKTKGQWRKLYLCLLGPLALYAFSSVALNVAISQNRYYSGSFYDLPFLGSLCFLVWGVLAARDLQPVPEPSVEGSDPWATFAQRAAMLAILALPLMGFWALFFDNSPADLRQFRLLVTLGAMLVLGLCIFVRQYALDRQLMQLLDASNQSVENLQRLQSQLVQKEKLASLGHLVAGAAHEINNPLAAILGYSELLAGDKELEPSQVSMAEKIGQQARRTRDLVSGLLSFAQQAPSEKTNVELGELVLRAVHMERATLESKKIHVETRVETDLPSVWGNSNQLFQCCLHIIVNAMDALEEVGGGIFIVSARREGSEVVLEFSDSGPGIRDPRRVFDPFYTTKPIGKGTGLGLSATYGVVQDHKGQITCHNSQQGGAVFVLRFPIANVADSKRQAAGV